MATDNKVRLSVGRLLLSCYLSSVIKNVNLSKVARAGLVLIIRGNVSIHKTNSSKVMRHYRLILFRGMGGLRSRSTVIWRRSVKGKLAVCSFRDLMSDVASGPAVTCPPEPGPVPMCIMASVRTRLETLTCPPSTQRPSEISLKRWDGGKDCFSNFNKD